MASPCFKTARHLSYELILNAALRQAGDEGFNKNNNN